VEAKGWEDLRKPDGLELDEYDREDTIYLMAIDQGRVLAGCRYTPTTAGPILAYKLYPDLFRVAPPNHDSIVEITRVFARTAPDTAISSGRSQSVNRAADELLASGPEFLRLFGCKGVVMLTEFKLVQAMLSWGCWPEPMGLPQDTRDGKLMAVVSHSTPLVAANVRQARGILGPQLAWAASPNDPPVLYADILGCDPISAHWQVPGPDDPRYRTPLQLAHMSAFDLAHHLQGFGQGSLEVSVESPPNLDPYVDPRKATPVHEMIFPMDV